MQATGQRLGLLEYLGSGALGAGHAPLDGAPRLLPDPLCLVLRLGQGLLGLLLCLLAHDHGLLARLHHLGLGVGLGLLADAFGVALALRAGLLALGVGLLADLVGRVLCGRDDLLDLLGGQLRRA